MPKREDLASAKKNKNNEFYTQYEDIEKEMNAYYEFNHDVFRNKTILLPCDDPEWSNFTKYFSANFNRFGIKKLISTSYAYDSKGLQSVWQPTLFEYEDPQYNEIKSRMKGKIFTLTKRNKKINPDDLKWKYLEGDGDFRSEEVTKLKDEVDIIITNPPFSLFREFYSWIRENNKEFLIIGNINCITYKDIFQDIKENKVWLGTGMGRWISGFIVPENYELFGTEAHINEKGQRIVSTNNCLWLTNLDHGKRHQPLILMNSADNLKFNKGLIKKIDKIWDESGYPKYDNFNGIEVPSTDGIPSDYDGYMGVPITFLNKYCPEQFEVIGKSDEFAEPIEIDGKIKQNPGRFYVKGKRLYDRLIIKLKR